MKIPSKTKSVLRRVSDGGFSLAEVAIAIGIAGVALFSVVGLMPPLLDSERTSGMRSAVPQMTTQVMGILRSAAYPTTLPKAETFYLSDSCHITSKTGTGASFPIYKCESTISQVPAPAATPTAAGGIASVGLHGSTVKLVFTYNTMANSPTYTIYASLADK